MKMKNKGKGRKMKEITRKYVHISYIKQGVFGRYLYHFCSGRCILREMNHVRRVLKPESGRPLRTVSHLYLYESCRTLRRISFISCQDFKMEQLARLHSQTGSSCDNPGVRADTELIAGRFVHKTEDYLRVCAVILVFGGHPKKVVSRLRIGRNFSAEGET